MSPDASPFDLIGIGFGPSGIALACALEDAAERSGTNGIGSVCFLERQQDSAWQQGLLLRETDIQHHFLRDLATPRDPRSRFTFANYLKEQDRIFEFGELVFGAAGGAVSRLEWSDYLQWAARHLSGYVRYGQEVTGIEAAGDSDGIDNVRVTTETDEFLAQRVVVCGGRAAFVPQMFQAHRGPRAFHATEFLERVRDMDRQATWRFAVVGSGQSAAEILVHLHGEFPRSTMTSIHRSIGFQLVDLSQFSNEIFHPRSTRLFFDFPPERKPEALTEEWRTNYGIIDQQIADTLYRKIYEDRVVDQKRIEWHTRTEVTDVRSADSGFALSLRHRYTGETANLETDVIVLCTGQEEVDVPAILNPLRDRIRTDSRGAPIIGRDYRVATSPEFRVPLYLSGLCERTHGIADATSFSGIAVRAETIYDALLDTSRI